MYATSMTEWRDVPGFEGRYLVSDAGQVARILDPTPPSGEYVRRKVKDASGKEHHTLAHLWVLEAFVGPRPEGAVARHLNDIKYDNRLENLAWGTWSENQQDAVINGRRQLKTHCPVGHPIIGNNIQMTSHSSARCRACNRARAYCQWHKVPFTKELADRKFEEVMQR